MKRLAVAAHWRCSVVYRPWAELPANATLDGLLEQVRDTPADAASAPHRADEARFLQRREERQEILESTLQALQAAKQKRQASRMRSFAENQQAVAAAA